MTTKTNAVPGADDITRVELDNGIVVLARPNFNSPSITIRGSLNIGGLFDTDKKLGLADFTATALMRGSANRDFKTIYDALESVGASLGFSGSTHTTGFSGKSLVEDLDLLLELCSDTLRQPAFPKEQVEKLRAQLLTSLALREQSTGSRASMAFDNIVYNGHPYSRPEEGHPETIKAIKPKDLPAFHTKHYGPRGLLIAIVGGIDPQEAVDKVAAALGDWQNPDQPDPPALPEWTPLTKSESTRIEIPGKSQSDMIIGTAGPPRSAPEYLAAALGNNIFGQFGMMGRIGDSVREQAGLAYYAYSSLGGSLGPGPWAITAGISPDNEDQAADLILKEVRRFVSELVTEEEISDSQTNFIGRMPLSLESNAGVVSALLHIERHNLGLDYYREYPDKIRAITRKDILQAAKKHLDPDKLATAIAGPPKE